MTTLEAASDAVLGDFVPHRIPGAAAVVLQGGRVVLHQARGLACVDPAVPLRRATPFDLASLTKALVTAPVCAALAHAGLLDPDAPIDATLPDAPPGVTARHLLAHTSGLPAWRPLFRDVPRPGTPEARRAVLAAARAVPTEAPPGARHTYSDVGFLLLLDLLERSGGARIDALFASGILAHLPPLALSWGHHASAATERCPTRGLLRGRVDDHNAWAMGGVSSHAGLFGMALSVAHLARALARTDGPVPEIAATLRGWWSRPEVGSHRGGWDTPTDGGSTGGRLPPGSVGHLGYTGTSMWCAPDRDTVLVLLTNRIHPRDDLTAIKALRPAWHAAVADALSW
jgi:CubicO group peptidase (beta-lactamase class C family)